MPSLFPVSNRKALRVILAVAASTWIVTVAGIYGFEWLKLHSTRWDVSFGKGPASPFRKFAMPGVFRPRAVRAADSTLGDGEEVIGVEVGGRARAYRLDALRDRSRHLVNDLVGEVPVSVAYCDLSECVSAYTGREGEGPLDVSVGGLYGGREMVLDVGGTLYFQLSGAPIEPGPGPRSIPLESMATTRTTWGEWRRRHPETDIYEGSP